MVDYGKNSINRQNEHGYEQALIMGIRLNDLEKSIDWNLVHNLVREEEINVKEVLKNIRIIISKIERIYYEEKNEELSEKQLADAYKEWANDPNEWRDIKAKY